MWHRLSVCLVSFAGCLGDDDDVVVFGDDGGNDDDDGGDDLCASSAECSLDVGTRFLEARSYCLLQSFCLFLPFLLHSRCLLSFHSLSLSLSLFALSPVPAATATAAAAKDEAVNVAVNRVQCFC